MHRYQDKCGDLATRHERTGRGRTRVPVTHYKKCVTSDNLARPIGIARQSITGCWVASLYINQLHLEVRKRVHRN